MQYFLSDLVLLYRHSAQSPRSRQHRARQATGTSVLSRMYLWLMSSSDTLTSSVIIGGMLLLVRLQIPSTVGVGVGRKSGAIASTNLKVYSSLVKL